MSIFDCFRVDGSGVSIEKYLFLNKNVVFILIIILVLFIWVCCDSIV